MNGIEKNKRQWACVQFAERIVRFITSITVFSEDCVPLAKG